MKISWLIGAAFSWINGTTFILLQFYNVLSSYIAYVCGSRSQVFISNRGCYFSICFTLNYHRHVSSLDAGPYYCACSRRQIETCYYILFLCNEWDNQDSTRIVDVCHREITFCIESNNIAFCFGHKFVIKILVYPPP